MSDIFFILLAVIFPFFMLLSRYEKSRQVMVIVFLMNIFFLMILYFINDALPFTKGGDDVNYYSASLRDFADVSDWFDLKQFAFTHEQPGYPLLLAWVHQFVGDSLYLRKVLNVEVFILLVAIWYCIGFEIGGVKVGKIFAIGVLLATPLWYYWIFMLKDMIIILLQSMLLYGSITFLYKRHVVFSIILIIVSTLFVIPLRVHLVYVSALIVIAVLFISLLKFKQVALQVLLVLLILGSFIYISQNKALINAMGVDANSRSLDIKSIEITSKSYMQQHVTIENKWIFPALFLVGEVAGFNPSAWNNFDMKIVRGVLAIPWIFIGVPLFLIGIFLIFFKYKHSYVSCCPENELTSYEKIKQSKDGLLLLIGFIVIYFIISWITHDTTRWRMPVLPAMAAVASWSWLNLRGRTLFKILLCWGLFLSYSLVIYYTFFK